MKPAIHETKIPKERLRTGIEARGVLLPYSNEERLQLRRYPPSEALSFFIERYWLIRWDLRGQEPVLQETLPYPCVNLVFWKGASAVYGVCTRKFTVTLRELGQVVGIKFKPGAFYPFWRAPISALTDRSLSLQEAFGAGTETLEGEILSLSEEEAQISRVESFLLSRLPPWDRNVLAAIESVRFIIEHPEVSSVELLSEQLSLSVRALQRLFQRYVGVSPKWVIRRFRLHEAAEQILQGKVIDWASLASELGYFDQPHFIKDFKEQVGYTPTEYAALCEERLVSVANGRVHPGEVRP